MGFRCKNCGGNVLFDVDSQSMKCQHCGTMTAPEDFRVRDSSAGEEVAEAGLILFTCGGCGARLQGTEDSQVGFCPYCGGQSLLQAPGAGESLPERLIPFQVSRDRCRDLFRSHTRKVRYLPREMRDASHLQSFTGIYMPYYEYDVEIGRSQIIGTKVVESTKKYDRVNTYQIDASMEGAYCGVPFDASRYYDDEIAARALPFDMQKEVPFSPAYLSGFYADASTVPADTYYRDAEETAAEDIVEEVARRVKSREGISVEKASSHVEARTRGHHGTMFPLWFLTWRKKDRVVYAVVNGESGKVVSDLPVDMKAFSMGCAAIAALVFVALELLVQPTPLITSIISLVAGILMAGSIRSATRQLFEKETHARDKGWTAGKDPAVRQTGPSALQARQSPLLAFLGKNLHLLPIVGFFVLYFVLDLDFDSLNTNFVASVTAVLSVVILLSGVRKVLSWQKSIPYRHPALAILLVLAAVVMNAAIVFLSPVDDAWYYLGDAACILILVAAAAVMLQLYNIGTTRPLPRLFDREEVG